MLNLLFTAKPGRRVAIGNLQLDATIRELHEYSNTVTENPIETGAVISDHVFENPFVLRIEGEITDSPLSVFGDTLQGIAERRIEAFEILTQLHESRSPITVVTGYDVYSNMVLSELVFPREVNTGRRLRFTCDLVRIRQVASQLIAIPQEDIAPAQQDIAPAQQDIAAGEVNVGKQQAAEVEDQQRAGSFLAGAFGL